MIVVFSPILSLIFTESSPYETPHDGVLEWECTVCLCPIKSSLKLIVSFPLRILNENEKLEKFINHNHLQRNNLASLSKCTIFGLGPSLLGVEIVRGRGVRLLTGMHRNGPEWTSITGMDLKIYPKIHVLSVLAKKFWFSNVKYQIP